MKSRARLLRLAGLQLATLISFSFAAQARLAYQDQVPSNALVVLGIGDTASFWNKAAALPFTKAMQQFLASPQISGSMEYQSFILERQKLEATLGFPLTPEELFKNVFSSVQAFVIPAAASGGDPIVMAIAGAKDKAKAGKLVQAIDKRNQEWAATEKPAADAGAAPTAKSLFEKVTIDGTGVSHIHIAGTGADDAEDGYYTLAGDRFLFSNNREALSRALKPAGKPASNVTQNPEFKKLTGLIPWEAAAVQGYVDGDAAMQLGGVAAAPAMLGAVPGLSKNNKMAFALDLQPDGVVGRIASSEDTSRKSTIQPRALAGLKQVPASPIMSVVYGMFDPQGLHNSANSLLPMLQAMGGGAGDSGQSPLMQFEQQTGISIEKELVPALGNEITISVNSFSFPQVDLNLGAEVRDRAKMQAVMGKLEKFIESIAEQFAPGVSAADGAEPGAAPAGPPKFQDLQKEPFAVRSLSIPAFPMVNPSYVILEKYVIISVTSSGLMGAIQRATGQQPAVTTAPAFSNVAKMAGTDQLAGFYLVDVRQLISNVIQPALLMTGGGAAVPPEAITFMDQVLTRIGTASGVETIKDGASIGYMKISMQ